MTSSHPPPTTNLHPSSPATTLALLCVTLHGKVKVELWEMWRSRHPNILAVQWVSGYQTCNPETFAKMIHMQNILLNVKPWLVWVWLLLRVYPWHATSHDPGHNIALIFQQIFPISREIMGRLALRWSHLRFGSTFIQLVNLDKKWNVGHPTTFDVKCLVV